MDIAGYIAALLIGLSLGLIGGGGSILTVPVLVYLFHIDPLTAVSYSLLIVGLTSAVGALNNYRRGYVDIKTALLFGLSSVITVYSIRKFMLPVIPSQFIIGNVTLSFGTFILIVFALLMVTAAVSMIRKREIFVRQTSRVSKPLLILLLYGIGLGIVTGFLGAGGGFILIPALVLILGMPMKTAIGTSLMIISFNSLIGFMGDIGHYNLDWKLAAILSAIAICGIFLGGKLGRNVDGTKLRKGFGWFVLVMGIYIVTKEIFL
ncbi:MAG: sulfite exporter TauE/SafE family protein [Ferruginibacter sp.]